MDVLIDNYIMSLYQDLEDEVIADIARRVKKTGRYTETAELMAKSMHEQGYSPSKIQAEVMKMLRADKAYQMAVAENTKAYKQEIQDIIDETVNAAKEANDILVAEAGNMAWNNDLSMWEQHGEDLTKPNNMSQLISAARLQTMGALKNLTKTMGFRNTTLGTTGILNAYQRELDLALIKVSTGVFSFDQAVNDCVHRLAQSGLRSIDYANGRTYQIDTAVRMNIRTGMSQLAGKVMEANLESSRQDLVITSQHMGSRPEHAPWQNKVFSYSGKSKKYPDFFKETGYGTVEGLKGANCTHDFYPFWEGASVIPEDIVEPDPVEIDGKEYDYYQATQRQRQMERNIRAIKREIEAQKAIGGPTTELNSMLKAKTNEYQRFSRKAGLKVRDNRLRVEKGSGLTKKKQHKAITKKVPTIKDANEKITRTIEDIHEYRRKEEGLNVLPLDEIKKDGSLVDVDLKDMDISLANATADQFEQLAKQYKTTCKNIKVGKLDVGTAPAGTNYHANTSSSEIILNKAIVKDKETFLEKMKKSVERGQFPSMDESNYEKYVVTHEFFHTLMDFESTMKNVMNAPTSHIRKARKEIKEIHERYKNEWRELELKFRAAEKKALETFDDADWKIAQKAQDELNAMIISKYADMSIDEFAAEAFADSLLGNKASPYSKEVLSVVDKYFKKTPLVNSDKDNAIKLDLQFFAKKHKRKKVPSSDPLWDSLVQGDIEQQMQDEIFEWEHGGYDYLIEFVDKYSYNILDKKKKPNIHE